VSPVIQAVIVAAIVAAAAVFVIVRAVRSVRGGKPACCTGTGTSACGSCSACPGCNSKPPTS